MIQYILECIAFQIVFLIIYDLFLKQETFFQWNRAYLLGTYILSMVLPWVKIEALRTKAPEVFQGYPDYWWNNNDVAVLAVGLEKTTFNLSWPSGLFFGGVVLATLLLIYKLIQIYALRKSGELKYYKDFTQIIVSNSTLAFSFFKSIFLGDKILKKEHQGILDHELVHIRQKHSYDLMFFELMRIVGWFNPLVYVYQSRVSELHEFIADAKVAKSNKKEQYELLLSQVFQTQNISFINQFFKSSLIKKRIVMLQKTKSGKIWRLKYLVLVPIVFGMLAFAAADFQQNDLLIQEQTSEDILLIEEIEAEINEEIVQRGSVEKVFRFFAKIRNISDGAILSKREYFKGQLLYRIMDDNLKVEFGDDVKPRKPRPAIVPPSTSEFINYVNSEKAFQILDENLRISLSQLGLKIRMVAKKDKILGPGEFVTVENASDLTGDEIREINSIIDTLDFAKSILFISDREHTFMVTQRHEVKTFDAKSKEQTATSIAKDSLIAFAVVDNVPVFPGCEDVDDARACFQQKMQRHISKNFNYPAKAQERDLQGRVNIMFTISKEGAIENLQLRGPDKILEDEAERIITRLPKMLPGKHVGEVVGVTYSIPITFKLLADEKEEPKEEDANSGVPFALVDKIPVFPGCGDEVNKRACFNTMMQEHISNNFNYPKEAQEKGIQGRVNIMFTIAKEGGIKNLRMRGPDQLLEEEARRIIMRLPDMKPGRHKGKNVDVPFSIPISFRLEDDVIDLDSIKLGLSFSIDPIYFVDGQESSKEEVSTINPNDIESMSVLKGEYALTMYGEKGKNGVIQIITKKKE